MISSNISQFPLQPPDTLLDSIMDITLSKKGKIGDIYFLLVKEYMTSLNPLKDRWEKDLSIEITESVWSKMMKGIHSSSPCMRHKVMQFKIFHRRHWIKVKVSHINSNIDTTCDRCKQSQATLMHMFWDCPTLFYFWQSIFDVLSNSIDKQLELSSPLAVFGLVTQNLF